jgi:hypothetical protein
MRVPGFSVLQSVGRSFKFKDGSRYNETTVASLMSVAKRS